MLSKYFFTALKKITAHAQNFSSTLYVFDYKRNEDGLSELKILVSVVRFRPGPPRFYKPPSGGFFILTLRGWPLPAMSF
jgi:hypothetical protein